MRALEDIPEGAELTMQYVDEDVERLLSHFGFVCRCRRCERRGERSHERAFHLWRRRQVCPRAEACGSGLGVPVTKPLAAEGLVLRCVHCAGEWQPDKAAKPSMVDLDAWADWLWCAVWQRFLSARQRRAWPH